MIVYVLLSVSVKSSLYLGLHCLNKSALGFSLRSPPVDHRYMLRFVIFNAAAVMTEIVSRGEINLHIKYWSLSKQ